MGGCVSMSSSPIEDQRRQFWEAINCFIPRSLSPQKQAKVLLLGPSDSGKSTILKQMYLAGGSYSSEEIESHRRLVYSNLAHGLISLVDAMHDMGLTVSSGIDEFVWQVAHSLNLERSAQFPQMYYGPLKMIWEDPGVQEAWRRRNEVAFPYALHYFFSNIDRIMSTGYMPDKQDFLSTYKRTNDITETVIQLKAFNLLVVDVGGHMTDQRKEWAQCFQDVTTVLFVASLSCYDQFLVESGIINQMQDTMLIWDSICHSPIFMNKAIVLLLNKNDLFEDKVRYSYIKTYFPDYVGPIGDASSGRQYFIRQFVEIAQKLDSERKVHVNVMTATNTESFHETLKEVQGQVVHHSLRSASLV